MKYVLALDQGTTSSRALLIDANCEVRGVYQLPFEQHFPKPGWVEHDALEILSTQLATLRGVLDEFSVSPDQIDSIGITNQRETTVLWRCDTGEPIAPAIVWQCRRTAEMVDALTADPAVRERIIATTGLIPDAYFSASKVKWLLDSVPGARQAAARGEVLFGTIDSWLVWNLTGGAVHATDVTNASRTMLFDIHTGKWDPWLLELFDVPAACLPEVRPSSGDFGVTAAAASLAAAGASTRATDLPPIPAGIPIRGVAGDQQAALFGQCCTRAGEAKSTYGTGCFLLMHTGQAAIRSKNNLVTTVAASEPGHPLEYALEGSVFMAGALIQWLRDELGLIGNAAESEQLARSVDDTAGVVVVPAFTGLGAPYWDAQARGAILGLTRGAGRAHIVRAALEALAFQAADLVAAMESDAGAPLVQLAVDGGASRNDFLMQFQADILGTRLVRPANAETTAAGAAFLAGLSSGFWASMDDIRTKRVVEGAFDPAQDDAWREAHLARWAEAVARVRSVPPF